MYIPAVGDRIRVKTATGDERLLRATGLGNGVVYVTTEAEYQRAKANGETPLAYLGFPAGDVSKADEPAKRV